MTEGYPVAKLPQTDFPLLLREIPDPPEELYLRGTLPPVDYKLLAVVGSRKYSTYGKEVTKALIAGLRSYPISIVSGLAIGTDATAHEAALDAGLHTIAVPGSGINDSVIYPRANQGIARRILEAGGALLSEYEPDFRATQWSFPKRNRIMAGMSHATLIIEARERSGTLITARLALEYNREVLTVPNSIFAGTSFGPHMLIRDGATPITSSFDILESLDIKPHKETLVAAIADPSERKLLKLLESPLEKDMLIRASGLSAHEANILITTLELKGYIREQNGSLMRIISI